MVAEDRQHRRTRIQEVCSLSSVTYECLINGNSVVILETGSNASSDPGHPPFVTHWHAEDAAVGPFSSVLVSH